MIYLAHPVDFASDTVGEIRFVAHTARTYLMEHGARLIYSPGEAFVATPPMTHHIQSINMHALMQAHAMLVLLPENVYTLGVPFEMGFAAARNIPTVVVRGAKMQDAIDTRKHSALLSYLTVPTFSFDALEQAAELTCKLANGQVKRIST